MAQAYDHWYLKVKWKQPPDERVHSRTEVVWDIDHARRVIAEYRANKRYIEVSGEVQRKTLEVYAV